MKGTSASLLALALSIGTATSQNIHDGIYDIICNTPPSGEQEVEPGIFATYGCARLHDKTAYGGVKSNADTPESCAAECAGRSPEGPCSWAGGHCYFYNAGAGSTPFPKAITIDIRKDFNKLKQAYDECKEGLTACKESTGDGDDNSLPGDDGDDNSLPGDDGDDNSLPDEGNSITGPHTDDFALKTKQCPGTGSTITVGDKKYRASCRTGQVSGPAFIQPARDASSLADCLQWCNTTPECTQASLRVINNARSVCYRWKEASKAGAPGKAYWADDWYSLAN